MTTTQPTRKRLASLDALRGMDMFWILGGQSLFAALFVLTGWTGWKVFEAWLHILRSDFPIVYILIGCGDGVSPETH